MLIYLYLFTLIIGAVLLGASILLGGKDIEAGGHADADAGAGAEGGLDKDVEVGGHGDFSGVLLTVLSLRFWTFFFAFFGLTGLTLDLLGLVGHPWLTLALALAMGAITGAGATTIFRKLRADTSGQATSSSDYIGKTARVVVPFDGKGVGKVRVDIKGNQIDLLASGIEDEGYAGKEEVLIVEMDGSRARVARVDGNTKRARSSE